MLEQIAEEVVQVKPLALSVIICTRDRADTLLPAVESILADLPSDGSAELVIIDQGRDQGVAEALAPLLKVDSRLRHVREHSVGLSVARNAGLRAARGELIAFTDDDCTVGSGWAAALKNAFQEHPEAGLIFGRVLAGPHDPSQGILPDFEAEEGPLTRKKMYASYYACWGMGANMALRRSAWEAIGPFDELMGAGAPLISGEDMDYALRAVTRDVGVYHSTEVCLVHHGFRPHSVASKLMKGYAIGKGAMYAKQVRAGNRFGTLLLLHELVALTRTVLANGLRGRRPLGANALIYELKGLWRGFWLPMERRRVSPVFRGSSASAPEAAAAQRLPA